ncbi:ABR161Cp [Eremothecium gossypii ATCC 10895]|uniref:adenosine kinase n=1 Tax=Eremothecium gossypii (strain ATCC 10895 / CBS 109.51 / FGSC 9923 / NRRL Y-1056) TaxID=284811 RepID=Q75D62_EREGS|nr:ABR161Cp [Eremothecium gossypii ATCC 10895]AAS50933.1 ABR161Cp [Eremothecium gossypii ATCC 10895]
MSSRGFGLLRGVFRARTARHLVYHVTGPRLHMGMPGDTAKFASASRLSAVTRTSTSGYRSVERTAKAGMSESFKLVCLGNPLLDISATVDPEYLERYSLKSNDAILVDAAGDDGRMKIFDEMLEFPGMRYVAGGAAQNTARGAAYVLGRDQVAYFGCVGRDQFSEKLMSANKAAGVSTFYQEEPEISTGKCAVMITGHDRSMVTDLGAANHFKPEHLDKHWNVVESAKMFYVGGFHLTVSPEAIVKLGKHAQENGKPFVLNFSAPFIPQFFRSALEQVLPYTTHIIANESEAASYAESFGLDCDREDLVSIAKHVIGDSSRTVVFTHGLEPTIVVSPAGEAAYPVHPVDKEKIVDTNGAGDAFAGGFVAALVQGRDLPTAVDMGQWLAALSIQEFGPCYPTEKLQY